MDLYWMYPFNIALNSFFSFFTALLLVEFFVRLLRVNHPRAKAICYFLPFSKICLDLFLYRVSNWAILHGLDPTLAEPGTRRLSIMINPFAGIQFSMQDGKTFSLADIVALSIGPFWVQAIVLTAIIGAIITFSLHLVRIVRDKAHIEQILRSAAPIRLNLNPLLIEWMEKRRVRLAMTPLVPVPCLARKTILFPTRLIQDLSQEQCEAVLAHELAHFHWRDCGLRLLYSLIAAVFWWIPTGWWQKRINEMQEDASDLMIHRFGISKFALAEAILKTARGAQTMRSNFALFLIERPSTLKSRMHRILEEPLRQPRGWKTVQHGLLAAGLLSILLGRLWIF